MPRKLVKEMTPQERRIHRLEQQVRNLKSQKEWAEDRLARNEQWAREAWDEVRRLHDVCTRHYEEMVRVRDGATPRPWNTV